MQAVCQSATASEMRYRAHRGRLEQIGALAGSARRRGGFALVDVLDVVARGAIPGGRLGDAAVAFLVGSLTPLAKSDGDVRPIAMLEALRRLLTMAVAAQFKEQFANKLAPLQCGVGLPGGGEVIQ